MPISFIRRHTEMTFFFRSAYFDFDIHHPIHARFPAKWTHFADKERAIYIEQILIAKVCNFGGICSDRAGPYSRNIERSRK
jgi:hypothetical protein